MSAPVKTMLDYLCDNQTLPQSDVARAERKRLADQEFHDKLFRKYWEREWNEFMAQNPDI